MDFTKHFYKKYGKDDKNIRIISVHSAKGGVGKTLFSLLMGNEICKNNKDNSRVFLMDLDFCGTSLSDLIKNDPKAQNKEKDHIQHIPVCTIGNKESNQENNKKVSWELLSLFNNYLMGKGLDELLENQDLKKAEKNRWKDKLVIIPSGKFDIKSMADSNLLFDTLHTEWFCEFIFRIIFHIYEAIRKDDDKQKLYFIMDNAPGWSELLPTLHTYMLKWGVHRAKFLQIATQDEMDIDASLENLEKLYANYLKIYTTKFVYLRKEEFLNKEDKADAIEYLDDDYMEELIGDDRDILKTIDHHLKSDNQIELEKIKDVQKNIALHISNFMALVLNKTFSITSLDNIEDYIRNKFKKMSKTYLNKIFGKKENLSIFSSFLIMKCNYDLALALIYQEHFIAQPNQLPESNNKKLTDDKFGKSSKYIGKRPVKLEELVVLDYEVYKNFLLKKPSFMQNKLINSANFHTFSHIMQGISVFFDMFRFCTQCLEPFYKYLHIVLPFTDHVEKLKFHILNHFGDIDVDRRLSDWTDNIASFLGETMWISEAIHKETQRDKILEILNDVFRESLKKESSKLQNLIKELFEFYFYIFTGTLIYLSKSDDNQEDQELHKEDTNLDGFKPLIKDLFELSVQFMNIAYDKNGLTEANQNVVNYIKNLYEKRNQSNPPETGITMKAAYLEVEAFFKSITNLEEKYSLIHWLKQMFKEYSPITNMGWLYIFSTLESFFKGYLTDVKPIKDNIETVYNSYRMIDDQNKKRVGHTIAVESQIKIILKEWGISINGHD